VRFYLNSHHWSSIDLTGKVYILSLHQFQYTPLHPLTENHIIDEKNDLYLLYNYDNEENSKRVILQRIYTQTYDSHRSTTLL